MEIQLAAKELLTPADLSYLNYPVAVEPKINGVRMLVTIKDGQGIARSRNGKDYSHKMQHVIAALLPLGDGIYDGEVDAGSWSETQRVLRSKTSNSDALTFWVFDYLSCEGDASIQSLRRRLLNEKFGPDILRLSSPVKLVHHALMYTQHEVLGYFEAIVKQGGEGIMVKNLNGTYKPGRSFDWRKMKPKGE